MADDSKYPTRIAPYGLRMPPDLKERVQSAADRNNRSMNMEIVAALEEAFPSGGEIDVNTVMKKANNSQKTMLLQLLTDELNHVKWPSTREAVKTDKFSTIA